MSWSTVGKCGASVAFLALFGLIAGGCSNSGTPTQPAKGGPPINKQTDADVPGKPSAGPVKEKDDHSGWWCDEHGLPEEVCDLCHKKYAAAEKAKGNWCEHNRVKTSCFKCNPGLKEKWAKVYEEKFGKKPPEPEPEEDPKEKGKEEKGKKGTE